jgi:hypothetical protein
VSNGAAETQNTQEDIQDWLQLDEGDPGFQHLTEKGNTAVTFYLFIFISTTYIIKFSFHLFLGLSFASLIRIIGLSRRYSQFVCALLVKLSL